MKDIRKIYRYCIQSRNLQFKVNSIAKKSKSKFPIHFAFGHEFVSSLVKYFFKKNDKLVLTHRNIHFVSLFSKNAENYYKKLFVKKDKKNMGSMNYFEKNNQILYSSSILGNNFSVACGLSFFVKKNSIVICNTGDGAIEEGSFYESLSMAKYLNLPIVFLIENNNWSMYTKIKERRCNINLKKLCDSMQIKFLRFKINNFRETLKNYKKMIEYCRFNSSPIVLELPIKTYVGYKEKKYINYHHGVLSENVKILNKFYFEKNDLLLMLGNKIK